MTKLMLEAIEALRQLPAEDDVARAVLRLTGRDGGVYQLSPEEDADLDEADKEIARGEFTTVSVEDIRRSIEESRTRARTSTADAVFDRLEARLKALAPQE